MGRLAPGTAPADNGRVQRSISGERASQTNSYHGRAAVIPRQSRNLHQEGATHQRAASIRHSTLVPLFRPNDVISYLRQAGAIDKSHSV